MRVLGIETSCDETGIAIYEAEKGLLAHTLFSQTELHAPFGGVVPELASRDHLRHIIPLIKKVLIQTGSGLRDLNGVAYTQGPGLVGALLIGAALGQSLAYALNIPAIGIHHLEGHLLSAFLESSSPSFPFLALLVSGGHTELIYVKKAWEYKILGETLDDAAGEAFDKTAKLLGLGYPGGAALAQLAEKGQKGRFCFPRPMVNRRGLDFSFSGLKTFAWHTIQAENEEVQTKADIAFAFQEAVVESLLIKCRRALSQTGVKQLVVAGGVSANLVLRAALKKLCEEKEITLYIPKSDFCTDNGAMIAYAGCQRLLAGQKSAMDIQVSARWSIENNSL